MKKFVSFIVALCLTAIVVAQETIGQSMCVASYNYTCHTTDKDGKPADVAYRLTLQVGQGVACSMGYAEHADSLKTERMEEARHHVPRCYQGYPDKKITAHEVMPFDRFVTTEAMGIKWRLTGERDTIMQLPCQKAVGEYHGRTWTAWFAPDIPSSAGPWRLHGLPGLILGAEADGVHRFECFAIDFVKEPIVLQPHDGVRAPHARFVKHRNNKMCGEVSFDSLIPVSMIDRVDVIQGIIHVNNIVMMDTDTRYQPLELK